MIAEGGTHRRHKVTIARSRAATGPFEGYEKNPLITGQPDSPITCVGHADLVQDTTGNWWALMLARRELGERGDSYPLGRETYMVPVNWPEGEFPIFEPVQLQHQSLSSSRSIIGAKKCSLGVEAPVSLSSPHTIHIRDPDLTNYSSEGNAITLRLINTDLGAMGGSPTFVGERQTSLASIVSAQLDLTSAARGGHTGLAVYKDPFRYASVDVDLNAVHVSFSLRHATQEETLSNSKPLDGATAVKLKIESSVANYRFSYSALVAGQWSPEVELATIPCSYMSGDDFTGWFPLRPLCISTPSFSVLTKTFCSGTVFGIYAYGPDGTAKFDSLTMQRK
jgi:beta-xylosidase